MIRRVLSIGEAMVELSPSDQDQHWRLGVAGDTLNTAWYLRRRLPGDWQVGYLSRVGEGPFSQRMVDFLDAAGIDTSTVSRDPQREIGLYAISLKNGERSFSYWRGQSAARGLADDPARLAQALDGVDTAYFSGITLAILPPEGRANLLDALRTARQSATRLVFDPNLRPSLWSDAPAMRDAITDAAGMCDLVLPSFDDEATHFGDADPQATIARYLSAGAGQVVVKAGGAPIHFGGRDGTGCISDLRPETPVDSTAAGDSFNAGYLAARLTGAPVEQAIQAGHDLSRKVIAQRGAIVEV